MLNELGDPYVYSEPCVTGGNSLSSSNLNPPRGGDSAAAAISWNFSESAVRQKSVTGFVEENFKTR